MATYISTSSSTYTQLATYTTGSATSSWTRSGSYIVSAAIAAKFTVSGYCSAYTAGSSSNSASSTITLSKIACLATLTIDNEDINAHECIGTFTVPKMSFTLGSTTFTTAATTTSFSVTVSAEGSSTTTYDLVLEPSTSTCTLAVPSGSTTGNLSSTSMATNMIINMTSPPGTNTPSSTGTLKNLGVYIISPVTASGYTNITWNDGTTTPTSATMAITFAQSTRFENCGYQWCWKVGSMQYYSGAGIITRTNSATWTYTWTIPTDILTTYLNQASYLSASGTSKTANITYQVRTYPNKNDTDYGAAYKTYTKTVTITDAYAPTAISIGPATPDIQYTVDSTNKYVAGINSLTGTLSSIINTDSGASLESYTVVLNNEAACEINESTYTIPQASFNQISIIATPTVVDSRGFSYTGSETILTSSSNAILYTAPVVSITTGRDTSDTTKGKVSISAIYTLLDQQANHVYATYTFDPTGGGPYTNYNLTNTGVFTDTQVTTTGWKTIDATGTCTVLVADLFNSVSTIVDIGTLVLPITIGKSSSTMNVVFGGIANNTDNKFVCNIPAQFNSALFPDIPTIALGTSTSPFNTLYLSDDITITNIGITLS